MKSPTTEFFRTDSAVFRFLFSVSLVILPFIQFLVEQRYLVLRLETVVYFLCLTAACLTFAWFTRKPVVFHAAAILWLCVMQVPYTQSLHDRLLAVKPVYLIIASFVLFTLLARLMRDNFYGIVLVVATAANIAGAVDSLAGPGVISVIDDPTGIVEAEAAPQAKPSLMIYLVLDAYMGPAGFSAALPGSEEVRRSIEDTFLKYGFTLYSNAFSHYAWTNFSMRSLLNLTLLDRVPDPDAAEQYRLFSHFKNLGWALSVYRFRSASTLWVPPSADRQVVYNIFLLGGMRDLPISWTDRLELLSKTYMNRSRWILLVMKNVYTPWVNVFGLEHWSPAVSLKVMDLLRRDILAAKKNTLFFAHLLAPHIPYIYQSDGSVWPVAELIEEFKLLGRRSNHREHADLHRRYGGQVLHLNGRLDEFLGDLQAAGVLASATIVVHGDHGSRLAGSPGKDVPLQRLLENYSTLLAVKKPGVSQGRIVRRKASVMEFLAEELYPQADWDPPPGLDSVYRTDDEGRFVQIPFLSRWTQEESSPQETADTDSAPPAGSWSGGSGGSEQAVSPSLY